MLARGLLCRLAADAPKTSTHDLPQLARLLQRRILAHHGLARPSICTLSRASKTAFVKYHRSYATTARATTPTSTVKKAVKKTAAKKAVAKKPKARATVEKAKPKKKPAAKPKPKPKRVKKELTPEEKNKIVINDLKKKALKAPPSRSASVWNVFLAEATAGGTAGTHKEKFLSASAKYRALTAAEKEHYNHLANERNAAKKAEFQAWIHSHTPVEINIANNARALLRRKLRAAGKSVNTPSCVKLHDDRSVKRPTNAYAIFVTERFSTGDLKGISTKEAFELIGSEWKALSASEKQKYVDESAVNQARYATESASVYGNKP